MPAKRCVETKNMCLLFVDYCIARYFCRTSRDCCIIFNPRLNGKPRDVHLYPALMECGSSNSDAELWKTSINGMKNHKI